MMICPLAFEMPCFFYRDLKFQPPKKISNDPLKFLELQSLCVLMKFQMLHIREGFRKSTRGITFGEFEILCKEIGWVYLLRVTKLLGLYFCK